MMFLEEGKLIKSLYKILVEKDELDRNKPIDYKKDKRLLCLDAKMNFDDNAIFKDQKF